MNTAQTYSLLCRRRDAAAALATRHARSYRENIKLGRKRRAAHYLKRYFDCRRAHAEYDIQIEELLGLSC